jgi:hypothetical protein
VAPVKTPVPWEGSARLTSAQGPIILAIKGEG